MRIAAATWSIFACRSRSKLYNRFRMHASHSTANRLNELIAGVREIVAHNLDAATTGAAVADVLREHIGRADLLSPEQIEPDPSGYRQHILHVEPDGIFSVV